MLGNFTTNIIVSGNTHINTLDCSDSTKTYVLQKLYRLPAV